MQLQSNQSTPARHPSTSERLQGCMWICPCYMLLPGLLLAARAEQTWLQQTTLITKPAGCGTSPGVLLWSPTSECVLATAYVLNATTKMATSMHQMTNRHDTCKCVCHGACTTSVYSAWKAGKQGVKLSILVLLKIIIALLTTRGDQVVYPYHPSLQAVS